MICFDWLLFSKYFDWEQAYYILDSGVDGRSLDPLIINSDTLGLAFVDSIEITSDVTYDELYDILPYANETSETKVFIVNVEPDKLYLLFEVANDKNLTQSGYGWILTSSAITELDLTQLSDCVSKSNNISCTMDDNCIWDYSDDSCTSKQYDTFLNMQGVVGIVPEGPSTFFLEANQFRSSLLTVLLFVLFCFVLFFCICIVVFLFFEFSV